MEQLRTMAAASSPRAEEKRGFWRRRVVDPLAGFLAQGVSPSRISRAIALGAVCGVFPFLGATTLLTLGAGLALRLNQPTMQTVNYLLSPVQLVLIPVFVNSGAWILSRDAGGFSVSAMLAAASEGSVGDFLVQFGLAGWYALVAWLIAAPALYVTVRISVSPFIHRLASARGAGGAEA